MTTPATPEFTFPELDGITADIYGFDCNTCESAVEADGRLLTATPLSAVDGSSFRYFTIAHRGTCGDCGTTAEFEETLFTDPDGCGLWHEGTDAMGGTEYRQTTGTAQFRATDHSIRELAAQQYDEHWIAPEDRVSQAEMEAIYQVALEASWALEDELKEAQEAIKAAQATRDAAWEARCGSDGESAELEQAWLLADAALDQAVAAEEEAGHRYHASCEALEEPFAALRDGNY